jgi:hypothetical protein
MPNVRLDTIKNQNTEIYSDWYLIFNIINLF